MRRLAVICLLGLIAVGFAYSQDWDNPQILKRLDLGEEEMANIREVFEKTEKEIREARLEIDILKAQLRKLLFQQQVNMHEVERLLRDSLEWEMKERMAQLQRQVQLRTLLGDTKYARLMETVETRRRVQEEEKESALRAREEKEQAGRARP
ncbi:MAG: hypothetical protein V3V57_02115 [Spirochaetia bacterium]